MVPVPNNEKENEYLNRTLFDPHRAQNITQDKINRNLVSNHILQAKLMCEPERKKQYCGTGTVGTVTFCLVEPEPEP